ncbi:hypothetical protein FXO38_14294 [Capsicum annuum]|nr:hypothetical protein FXO38_14294 [Capsicum annuum]
MKGNFGYGQINGVRMDILKTCFNLMRDKDGTFNVEEGLTKVVCFTRNMFKIEVHNGKRPLEDDQEVENVQCRLQKQPDGSNLVEVDLSLGSSSASPDEHSDSQDHDEQDDNQNHAGDNSYRSMLFPAIDHDSSINSHSRCSRSHYGAIASLNHNFRSIIRSSEIYTARQ